MESFCLQTREAISTFCSPLSLFAPRPLAGLTVAEEPRQQWDIDQAEAKLARHQATAARSCRKSAAPVGPARAAPIAQQKLATNWRASEICSLCEAVMLFLSSSETCQMNSNGIAYTGVSWAGRCRSNRPGQGRVQVGRPSKPAPPEECALVALLNLAGGFVNSF